MEDLSAAELAHEEDVIRRPYVLKAWLSYLQALEKFAPRKRFLIFERALAALPGSYKLWYAYLEERMRYTREKHPQDVEYERLHNLFERALVFMHKMPVIWEMFCSFLLREMRFTEARHACDRALRALPVTQHGGIWSVYLALAHACGVPETGARVLRRYSKLEPNDGVETLFGFLVECGRIDEAAAVLAEALENPGFTGKKKSKQQLWNELARLAVEHPKDVSAINVDALLRGGIRAATEEVGELWVLLAEYYARSGIFDRSRDVYEEGLTSVTTVRDFAVVFDAYSKFEEALVTSKVSSIGALAEPSEVSNMELEMLLSRLERLTERRPYLLSSVILRQNAHNVHEWHKRARLYRKSGDTAGAVEAYTQAVKIVDPWKATNGRPHTLWLAFARLYEDHKDLASARKVFDKAVTSFDKFRGAEDLAAVWCEYVEFEIRNGDLDAAEKVLRRATTRPVYRSKVGRAPEQGGNATAVLGAGSGGMAISHNYSKEPPSMGAWRSTRLWSLYADFEESTGNPDRAMKVYESMLDLKVATVANVLAAADYLVEHRHFENAFRIYERGIALFKWPAVLPLHLRYLSLFVGRFGGRKLERARELFEEAIAMAPQNDKYVRILFLRYAELEEKVGLARRAMDVFARAVRRVPKDQQVEMFWVYAAKAAEMFGVTRMRLVFEDALELLSDRKALVEFSQRFALLETVLGEVDRARAVYSHGAQFADPEGGDTFTKFWQTWDDFEVAHGSEDTYSEMLRIKRSVATQYSHVNISTATKAAAAPVEQDRRQDTADAGLKALEEAAAEGAQLPAADAPADNKEEIELDLDEDEDEDGDEDEDEDEDEEDNKGGKKDEVEGGAEGTVSAEGATSAEGTEEGLTRKRKANAVEVEEKPVPAAVFGGLMEDKEEAPRNAPLGALERLKRKRG
mmetsp:Transcript_7686/g.23262  ORF Transcript_7686/g.23262 Transcript_7686/m.23262 type:complete len:918 (+) Transcript_7686:163-2916(+)|eukprot:CAMPEP_0198736448 /NCGR_PEP_ID=MMETSP1475-20131203/65766_1 /TAXON_ID= ORGANISM="Unidentified sp., Strain CCMP1999" /NCGR_SAMPLE_ID=MMETSP1475 /ASSEMBLY_ACC=CAM_ASM_001111 /LENGTH=917 /DNA_ID=CAMNT_0044500259 /DNA_START=55 /DNA_END=2808 /DNA_ORIENTATION=+